MVDLIQILKDELIERKRRNTSYSLRALARDLNVSPTALSQFMNGRRELSKKNESRVAEVLGIAIVPPQSSRSNSEVKIKNELLKDSEFKMIANWYYWGILNLAKLSTCPYDSKWIAERLNIDSAEADAAIYRLIRMGYIKVEKQRLVRTKADIRTVFDIPSEAIKQFHHENLGNAQQSLKRNDPEDREFITNVAAINTSQIPIAKKMIRRFIVDLCNQLQKGKVDDVFSISLQLFPLTSLKNKRN